MDIRIWSVIISAGVALFIAVLNHFIVTPWKERRRRLREQYSNLYAPAYALICASIKIAKRKSLLHKSLSLGSKSLNGYQSLSNMEQFIHERSGYANDNLINAWVNYSSQLEEPKKEYTEDLVISIVKGYNQLKKQLGMKHDKEELKTGIPDCIKEYREFMDND
ncbi:hypothetical protein [Gracilibacillus saliphilus]|uniref:hypothetical protein n=1 Tax=Gracilibacillus saliphilus TaxID=543890 RepID=UPI0013D5F529|nr:hypothetical protein [Gracilibacillus saliphilus]